MNKQSTTTKSKPEHSDSASSALSNSGINWALLLVDIWWQSRIKIILLTLLGIAIATAALLLLPNQYRAESRVIVLPPRFLPEVRTEPLTVATANELLGSAFIVEQVLNTFKAAAKTANEVRLASDSVQRLAGASPQEIEAYLRSLKITQTTGLNQVDAQTSSIATLFSRLSPDEIIKLSTLDLNKINQWTVDDLSRWLSNSTTVDQRTAVDIKLSPLIKLMATSDDPGVAQLLANIWALIFEQAYDTLSTTKTRRQYESILNQQKLSATELNQAQADLVAFKSRHNLELYLRLIEQYSLDFQEQSRQLLAKQNALRTQSGQLQQLLAMSSVLQQNGEWIGSIGEGSTTSTPYTSPTAVTTVSATVLQLATQTVETRNQLQQAIADYDTFYENLPLDLYESTRDQLRKEYLEISNRLRVGQARYEQLSQATKALKQTVSETSQAIVLNISPTPDALAMASILNGIGQTSAGVTSYSTEVVNPLWNDLSRSLAASVAEQNLLVAELNGLNQRVTDKEEAYRTLQTTVTKAQLSSELIKENLERWKKAHDELFASYVMLTNDAFNTARSSALLEEEVRNLDQATSRTRAMIEEIQETYNTASAEQSLLETRLKAVQRRADLLFQKLQDAQTAVAEEVSDVTVAARAVLPGRHYFPRRSLLLPAASFVVFLTVLVWATWTQRRRLFS